MAFKVDIQQSKKLPNVMVVKPDVFFDFRGDMWTNFDKKTHHILGIHIVGADACNLIHIGLSLMSNGGYAQDLINMIFRKRINGLYGERHGVEKGFHDILCQESGCHDCL